VPLTGQAMGIPTGIPRVMQMVEISQEEMELTDSKSAGGADP